MRRRGFTLLETLVAISLAATVILLVFSAWTRANESERRLESRRLREFSLYRTMDALCDVTAGMSRTHVFRKGAEPGPCFVGSPRSMIFLTRTPLTAAVPGLHLFRLDWDGKRLLGWETRFNPDLNPESMEGERVGQEFVLISGVTSCRFSFRTWDHRQRKWQWLDGLNADMGMPLPSAVAIELTWKNETRRFELCRILVDEDERIPASLLQ